MALCVPLLRGAALRGAVRLPGRVAARRRLLMCDGGRASAAVIQDERKASAPAPPAAPMDLKPPRGTRDFYPHSCATSDAEDMSLRTWLFGHWRAVAGLHGFEEYDAPVLESEELYVRKAGEDVTKQLYSMEDQSGRKLALRPEMTPSLARMVLARRGGMNLPVKWFSIPQCWRYERMTRGRRREHYQWNLDVWGVDGVAAEAELLAAAVGFCERVGLTAADVGVKVSTRGVLAELLSKVGVPAERFAAVAVVVDKLDKLPEEEVRSLLGEQGLGGDVVDALLGALAVRDFDALAGVLGAESAALAELRELWKLAEAYGYADWLVLDTSVVRGLAYYTGIVFEGFDRKGELRAIFGGGRYDKLLSTFGADDLAAAGFGFGDAVIVELLKERKLMPELGRSVDAVVFAMGSELRPQAAKAAAALRAAGVAVDLVLEDKKTKWVFKHADRLQAGHVFLLAPDEMARGTVKVKELATGEQEEVALDGLAAWAAKRE